MKETDLQRVLQMSYSDKGRLFKVDNGLAYHRIGSEYVPFKYGPGVGVSDLIGFTKIKITEDMVGKELPVFTAFEVKTKTGRASEEQKNFIAMVEWYNGIASVVRSELDLKETIDKWHTK